MALRSLRLRDFRCFPALSCPLAGGETLFVGDNAQGKTSILEAVCVLLRLQSPRSSTARGVRKFRGRFIRSKGSPARVPVTAATRTQHQP